MIMTSSKLTVLPGEFPSRGLGKKIKRRPVMNSPKIGTFTLNIGSSEINQTWRVYQSIFELMVVWIAEKIDRR